MAEPVLVQLLFARDAGEALVLDLVVLTPWCHGDLAIVPGTPFTISVARPAGGAEVLDELVDRWADTAAVLGLSLDDAEGETMMLDGPEDQLVLGIGPGWSD